MVMRAVLHGVGVVQMGREQLGVELYSPRLALTESPMRRFAALGVAVRQPDSCASCRWRSALSAVANIWHLAH